MSSLCKSCEKHEWSAKCVDCSSKNCEWCLSSEFRDMKLCPECLDSRLSWEEELDNRSNDMGEDYDLCYDDDYDYDDYDIEEKEN